MVIPAVTPVVVSVLGCIAGYYGKAIPQNEAAWFSVIFLCLFILISLISFLRVISRNELRGYVSEKWFYYGRKSKICITALSTGFCIGLAAVSLAASPVRLGIEPHRITGIRGIVADDPRILRDTLGLGSVDIQQTFGKGMITCSARGNLMVFFPMDTMARLKEFGKGCTVFLDGEMMPPKQGNPPAFMARSVHIISPPSWNDRIRTSVRIGLLEKLEKHPWGGLAAALLLGSKDNLDGTLADAYRNAGCSHILALSGMHLAIISSVIAFLLTKPFGKKAAAAIGIGFITLYVYIVGPQPSLLRAAIMYTIGAAAVIKGFSIKTPELLGLAFMIQLVIVPSSGMTISFILSYLALAGIVFLNPPINELLKGLLPEKAGSPLGASIAAFTATSPVVSRFFGILRPVGIPAGLVLVPLTTLFMIISMVWFFFSFCFPLAALPVGIILTIIYDVLTNIVAYAAVAMPGINSPGYMLFISSAMIFLLFLSGYYLDKKRRYIERFD